MIISPAKRISGRLAMPGDKSISHRAAMIAAIAEGASRLANYSTSQDCAATLSCLKDLGVSVERHDAEVRIEGAGFGLRAPNKPLDCANSGTTIRLLSGVLAGQNFDSCLTGDESLCSRPMQRIVEPLEMMGARILSADGRPPLTIQGSKALQGIDYELLIASAQVKSCILLAGLGARGKTTVIENEVTRDHTERLLGLFGASIETGKVPRNGANARQAVVNGPAHLHSCVVSIPGDISSAAYFVAAAALIEGSFLEVTQVGVNPTRVLFVRVLQELGFDVAVTNVREESNEPVGTVTARGRESRAQRDRSPFTVPGVAVPQLIDELPLLAVVGSQLAGGIEIRGAKELRVKESDRIASVAAGLKAMGATIDEFDDGLRVAGPVKLRGSTIDPRGDHRIAMAFSVAALIAEGESEITDAGCVGVSFPEFFDLLEAVIER